MLCGNAPGCRLLLIGQGMRPPLRSSKRSSLTRHWRRCGLSAWTSRRFPSFTPASSRWSYSQGKLSANRAFRTNAASQAGNTRALRRTSKFSPCRRFVTVPPEDTFGISKILPDYVVETTVHRVGQSSTKVEISHYYSTPTLKAKLLNLVAKRRIARDTLAT